MLQIVIWGMAILLVVKALDVAHQEAIARRAGTPALAWAIATCAIAALGALLLIVVADRQVATTSPLNSLGTSGSTSPSSEQSVDQTIRDADAQANAMDAEASRLDAVGNH